MTTDSKLVLTEHAIKRHAKRLHDEIKKIKPDLTLNQAQQMLAKVFGMNNWQELKSILNQEEINIPELIFNIYTYDELIKSIPELFKYSDTIFISSNEKMIINHKTKGITRTANIISNDIIEKLINHIDSGAIEKLTLGHDVDLAWNIKVDTDNPLRFRVNITSIFKEGQQGYSITIKIINNPPSLDTLNLPQDIINNIKSKQGLVVIAGHSDSGKSTLLSSILNWRMRESKTNLKILTYETPIEYVYENVHKSTSTISKNEIGTDFKTFADGIKHGLKRSPDIILVGEIRDRETINSVITASLTGHLVYTSLNGNGVVDAFRRMISVYDTEEKKIRVQDILASLKIIVGQILVPSTYGRRIAIREYLVFNEEVVDILLNTSLDNLTHQIKEMLVKYGKTFLQDAKEKYDAGLISEKVFLDIKRSY